MVEPSPFSSEWYPAEPSRMSRGVPEWLATDRRVSAVFVLLLVVATVVLGR